jgi:hypothetical protein
VSDCGTLSEWLQETLTKWHLAIGEALRDTAAVHAPPGVKMTSQTQDLWGEILRGVF